MEMVSIAELSGDDGELLFARIRYRGINFTINKEGWYSDCASPLTSGQTPPIIFYMYVDDVPAIVEQMEKQGASILVKPRSNFGATLRHELKIRSVTSGTLLNPFKEMHLSGHIALIGCEAVVDEWQAWMLYVDGDVWQSRPRYPFTPSFLDYGSRPYDYHCDG